MIIPLKFKIIGMALIGLFIAHYIYKAETNKKLVKEQSKEIAHLTETNNQLSEQYEFELTVLNELIGENNLTEKKYDERIKKIRNTVENTNCINISPSIADAVRLRGK